mgnify:CR=1 FL=1
MPGTHTDTWLEGLVWLLTALSLVGLLSFAARLVARRLLLANRETRSPQRRDRTYATVRASEHTGENLRPLGVAAQRSGSVRETV